MCVCRGGGGGVTSNYCTDTLKVGFIKNVTLNKLKTGTHLGRIMRQHRFAAC